MDVSRRWLHIHIAKSLSLRIAHYPKRRPISILRPLSCLDVMYGICKDGVFKPVSWITEYTTVLSIFYSFANQEWEMLCLMCWSRWNFSIIQPGRQDNKVCGSDLFNYFIYELELAVRKAAKDGLETPGSSVRTTLTMLRVFLTGFKRHTHCSFVAQRNISLEESIPRTLLPSFIIWADEKVRLALTKRAEKVSADIE
jgi:hypothetical protein